MKTPRGGKGSVPLSYSLLYFWVAVTPSQVILITRPSSENSLTCMGVSRSTQRTAGTEVVQTGAGLGEGHSQNQSIKGHILR